MSKPALGRGLGSLLSRENPSRATPFSEPASTGGTLAGTSVPDAVSGTRSETPKAGVTLLLAGRESRETSLRPEGPGVPRNDIPPGTEAVAEPRVSAPVGGTDGSASGSPFASSTSPLETDGTAGGIPGWILPALYASDAVMLCVAALWTFAGSGGWRWGGIGGLVAVGCVQSLVAWNLQRLQAAAAQEAERRSVPVEGPGAVPRLRVHFVDELPRNRR